MKNLLMLLMASCAISFTACQMPAEHEHAEETIDMDALRAELQGMEDAYATAQMAKDAEAVVVYYADDAQSLQPNGPTLVGKAAILADTKARMAEDEDGGKIRFEVVDVYAQGNLAVEVGKSFSTAADGTQTTGKYISVFENRDGKWICIRDSYSDDTEEKHDDEEGEGEHED